MALWPGAETCRPAVPAHADLLDAPVAAQRPKRLEMHGDVREDPYYWLRDDDREDPDVIAHLKVGGEGMAVGWLGNLRGRHVCRLLGNNVRGPAADTAAGPVTERHTAAATLWGQAGGGLTAAFEPMP